MKRNMIGYIHDSVVQTQPQMPGTLLWEMFRDWFYRWFTVRIVEGG